MNVFQRLLRDVERLIRRWQAPWARMKSQQRITPACTQSRTAKSTSASLFHPPKQLASTDVKTIPQDLREVSEQDLGYHTNHLTKDSANISIPHSKTSVIHLAYWLVDLIVSDNKTVPVPTTDKPQCSTKFLPRPDFFCCASAQLPFQRTTPTATILLQDETEG